MIEKALHGSKTYWTWIAALLAVCVVGGLFYIKQFNEGLSITGLSRDVSWGFYIAQFTFMVGVAASAVMVVLPYYLHNFKAFGKLTVIGEFLAVGSVLVCMGFIFVDMGQPFRIINVFRYPTPNSMMFWDTVVVFGYLILNLLISFTTFTAERKGIAPPKWIKPIIIISIPWAVSIHTVTAFLYSGLSARPFWMTAVLAPRFLATAFSAGPALLILLILFMRKNTEFDAGKEAIKKLAIIATYAMAINVFFILMEIFTAVYSGIPEHLDHFKYLFTGLNGHSKMVPWMWTSVTAAVLSLIILFNPRTRNQDNWLGFAAVLVFASIWIDKGLGMVVVGFIPNPLGAVTPYWPTMPEIMISLAVYAMGALVVTLLIKIALSVRKSIA